MALRAGYKGFKKLISPLILNRPGTIEIDGDALNAELNDVFFPRSEQTALGARNLFLTNNIASGSGLVTISNNGKNINVKNTNAAAYQMVKFDMPVEKNTDYTFSVDIDYVSGAGEILISNTAEDVLLARINSDVTADREWSATFNTGENSAIRFRMYCTRATSETGEINYNNALLRLASDPDTSWSAPAMTNQQLTGEVEILNGSALEQKTAINAIIAAATGAADFAAFKTAMGAITPVTRSAAPAATREVTEEVIEEEPVTTKKTTRKKSTAAAETEKEGE